MPRSIDLMRKREEEIVNTLLHLKRETDDFAEPRLILIGGYALRAFIPISRYTRDCNFALTKKNGWHLDSIEKLLPTNYQTETLEKQRDYGYLRCLKMINQDQLNIKIAIDFMEGAVAGRGEKDVVRIDTTVEERSNRVTVPIADQDVEFYVPSYRDYFLLKLVSSRSSDVRDIASLIKEHGFPDEIEKRARELMPHPEILKQKMNRMMSEIKKEQFLDSWRGAFATSVYTEKDKAEVLEKLKRFD